MAQFLICHGAWSAAWAWKKVRPLLRAAGHEVFTPTYTGLGERAHLAGPMVDLELHIQDVLAVIEYEGLDDFILLGHSSMAGWSPPASPTGCRTACARSSISTRSFRTTASRSMTSATPAPPRPMPGLTAGWCRRTRRRRTHLPPISPGPASCGVISRSAR